MKDPKEYLKTSEPKQQAPQTRGLMSASDVRSSMKESMWDGCETDDGVEILLRRPKHSELVIYGKRVEKGDAAYETKTLIKEICLTHTGAQLEEMIEECPAVFTTLSEALVRLTNSGAKSAKKG